MKNENSTSVSRSSSNSRGIKSNKNRHVQLLTIGRDMKCPRTGQVLFQTQEEIREAEFYLRRAWAHTILHIVREHEQIPWRNIQDFTGRTRQSWNMVVNAFYLTAEQQRDPETYGRWKPVTDGFIRNVTETLEAEDRKFRLYTEYFVEAWLLGMEVTWNNGHQQRFTRERLGSVELTSDDFLDGQPHVMPDFLDAKWTEHSHFCQTELSENTLFSVRREPKGNPLNDDPSLLLPDFPLLETNDDAWGQQRVWEYMIELEERIFGDPDPITGEPDKRAVNLHAIWKHTHEESPFVKDQEMADVNKWKESEECTKEQIQEMMQLDILDEYQGHMMLLKWEKREYQEEEDAAAEEKMDDMESFAKDIEDDYANRPSRDEILGKEKAPPPPTPNTSAALVSRTNMQPITPVNLTFDIDPKFLNDEGVGSVNFKVNIKYKQGMKVGHSIEVVGWTS